LGREEAPSFSISQPLNTFRRPWRKERGRGRAWAKVVERSCPPSELRSAKADGAKGGMLRTPFSGTDRELPCLGIPVSGPLDQSYGSCQESGTTMVVVSIADLLAGIIGLSVTSFSSCSRVSAGAMRADWEWAPAALFAAMAHLIMSWRLYPHAPQIAYL
jgi:hypothetical protein